MKPLILIGELEERSVEMAERKGKGHPDTICDELVETISIALCNYYFEKFGRILHYNIDKALLIGGSSQPSFGGGRILNAIQIIIAGRVTLCFDDRKIPAEDIALTAAHNWFKKEMPEIDPDKHVQFSFRFREGSNDLKELINHEANKDKPALSNDTSFGAGYFPLSAIQEDILKIDRFLHDKHTRKLFPFLGKDTKIMGSTISGRRSFTIAVAFIDRYITDTRDYYNKKNLLADQLRSELNLHDTELKINTADNEADGTVYMTVLGTSAENGDDGQVGRGNRVNGLITPYYPMTLEAVSGKNPISHVGKIYNHFAMQLSRKIVLEGMAEEAHVFIASEIGIPVNEPKFVQVKLKNQRIAKLEFEKYLLQEIDNLNEFWKQFIWQKD